MSTWCARVPEQLFTVKSEEVAKSEQKSFSFMVSWYGKVMITNHYIKWCEQKRCLKLETWNWKLLTNLNKGEELHDFLHLEQQAFGMWVCRFRHVTARHEYGFDCRWGCEFQRSEEWGVRSPLSVASGHESWVISHQSCHASEVISDSMLSLLLSSHTLLLALWTWLFDTLRWESLSEVLRAFMRWWNGLC